MWVGMCGREGKREAEARRLWAHWPCATVPRCLRISALSGGEVFGLVSTECLSAGKDPSSPHRDSGVRFQPVPEGRITAPVMGSFTAGAAPGFPRGRGFGWDRAKTQHTITKCALGETLCAPRRAATLSELPLPAKVAAACKTYPRVLRLAMGPKASC